MFRLKLGRFGFTSKQSALLSVPSGVLSILVCLSSAWIAGKSNQRLLTLMAYYPLGIIGASLMAFLPAEQKAGKMIGNYLTNMVPSESSIQAKLPRSRLMIIDAPLIYAIAAANCGFHLLNGQVLAADEISLGTYQESYY